MTSPPVALTIAGTDSGGCAGVAADLKAFASHGAHGVFAVTVITAQNTTGIEEVQPVGAEMVGTQIDAVLDDFDVAAAKTGLLFDVDTIEAVAERVEALPRLVVDPVLVRSSGEAMLSDEVAAAYRLKLFPHATVITPNVAEARLLTGQSITSREDLEAAAAQLQRLVIPHVVVTGFLDGREAVDAHATADGVRLLSGARVSTKNVLGSGCSFAASIAARLAHGDDPSDAIDVAKESVQAAIARAASWRLGEGRGPIAMVNS